MSLCRGIELTARLRKLPGGHREPWNKRQVVFRAVVDDVFVLTIAEVVQILYAYDVDHLARPIDLIRLHFAQANVTNLSLFLQLFNNAERLFHWNLWIDAMQLPKIDPFHL